VVEGAGARYSAWTGVSPSRAARYGLRKGVGQGPVSSRGDANRAVRASVLVPCRLTPCFARRSNSVGMASRPGSTSPFSITLRLARIRCSSDAPRDRSVYGDREIDEWQPRHALTAQTGAPSALGEAATRTPTGLVTKSGRGDLDRRGGAVGMASTVGTAPPARVGSVAGVDRGSSYRHARILAHRPATRPRHARTGC
jgi:hypothetical protein